MSSTPNVLEGAKKALENANNFTHSVTKGKPNAFTPKPPAKPAASEAAPKSDYQHARDSRSFAGIQADSGAEYKGASEAHDANVAALKQQ